VTCEVKIRKEETRERDRGRARRDGAEEEVECSVHQCVVESRWDGRVERVC
jgi:hypothetical protein